MFLTCPRVFWSCVLYCLLWARVKPLPMQICTVNGNKRDSSSSNKPPLSRRTGLSGPEAPKFNPLQLTEEGERSDRLSHCLAVPYLCGFSVGFPGPLPCRVTVPTWPDTLGSKQCVRSWLEHAVLYNKFNPSKWMLLWICLFWTVAWEYTVIIR